MTHITIQAKIAGRRGHLVAPLELRPERPLSTARELLTEIVRQQVAAFARRKHEAGFLRILTPGDVDLGRETGRIVSGEQEPDDRMPDVEQAVDDAISAFQDGFYYLFVNDIQVELLDQILNDVGDVLIVRLTPLAGG
ncbi:hypothetical protein [uncultured Paludibaculum sp.]|uniref:hypothetical protein n=1 Tax=uncultured Paludibaculum sp. TaxID=1765020 RepID=UPI002AABCED9|nr:hypothetical protein [uncultured Paludibaculum sp.]